jgi:sortase A
VKTWARPTAVLLALAGTAILAWVGVTLVWGEPYTAIKAARAQGALKSELAGEGAAWTARRQARPSASVSERAVAFRRELEQGDAFGRITIPRLGLRTVVVQGTDRDDLARGPGHYPTTPLPGLGGTVAIAGHRTTYLQPFRHIDELQAGDRIVLTMPYGTFQYIVYTRAIVDDHDWSIVRPRSFEQIVLTACHPLYSASQRIVVSARLRSAV